ATSSDGSRLSASTRRASGVVATRPAWRTRPSSHTATCANSRCTSKPILRGTALPSFDRTMAGRAGGQTTTTDSRSKRIRVSRRGGQVLTRARGPSNDYGLPDLRLLPDGPVPDGRTVLTNRDATGIEAVNGHRAY